MRKLTIAGFLAATTFLTAYKAGTAPGLMEHEKGQSFLNRKNVRVTDGKELSHDDGGGIEKGLRAVR